jgi:hypothetical protein
MNKLFSLLALAGVAFAAAPGGAGETWVYDAANQTVRRSIHSWNIANHSGAASIRLVWGYSEAEVNDPTRQMSCIMPCSAVMETTGAAGSLFYKLQPLDSAGNILLDGPVSKF